MVTASKIRCFIVVASPEKEGMNDRTPSRRPTYRFASSTHTKPRFRPSDLLPWADPHIRSLVEQLQEEVRQETAAKRMADIYPPAAESIVGDDLFDEDWFTT